MNTTVIEQSAVIRVVSRPANEFKQQFLKRHFGENYFWVEPASSDWLKSFSDLSDETCSTDRWDWYELSNGGAYMLPPAGLSVHFRTPYSEGKVSSEAAGI